MSQPDAGASTTSPRFHVHPHSAHLTKNVPVPSPSGGTPIELDEEDEEHDYESLPVGAGAAVNMAAGAMVRIFLWVLISRFSVMVLGSWTFLIANEIGVT